MDVDRWMDHKTKSTHREREKKRSKTLSQTTQVKAKTRSGGRQQQQQQQQKTPTTGVVYAAQNGVSATSDSWRLLRFAKGSGFFSVWEEKATI